MDMELSTNTDLNNFNYRDADTYKVDLTNFEITCYTIPFYHSMHL